ncbi:MAG: hypothetical protein ACOVSI_16940, partial [Gemmatimonas sp.]
MVAVDQPQHGRAFGGEDGAGGVGEVCEQRPVGESLRGQLPREATFYISSNDYYDIENYATRLVNGNLVIYTPLDLSNVDPRRPMQYPL